MFTVQATRKLLERLGPPHRGPRPVATTALGDWHATVLFWRPQPALFVNDRTLVPVLMPLAPAATVLERFPLALGELFAHLKVPGAFVEAELAAMAGRVLSTTSSRSVLGVMNEYVFLAEHHRRGGEDLGLLGLAARLAHTPLGPLRSRSRFPDRELAATVDAWNGA